MQVNERLLPLVEVIEQATGQRVNLSTALRWCQQGVGGIRLESWKLGGRRLTSAEAVGRFLERTTAASDSGRQPVHLPSRSSASAHASAMRQLEADGL